MSVGSGTRVGTRLAWIVPLVVVVLAATSCGGGSGGSGGGDAGGFDGGWSDPVADDSDFGASEPEPPEPVDITWHVLVQRMTVGMQPSLSMECYTFYGDGFVELRHNGATDITDIGTYSGDDASGTIDWDSGRSSWYEGAGSSYGSHYVVNGAQGSVIEQC